ncbi:SemiSWEET transporter [Vibrio maerlii]|uniref:SemiSWEET transporter n=1 Tax=Vibrio maerlii TaxID=2231648 RepID=UPI000E3DF6AB|nr:SemiSWEET transporter [Vibrio maerlii]
MFIEPVTLGYIAAFCTTCSFIPQVIHTVRTKDTEAISLGMYSFFVFGVSMWLVYGIMVNDLPIIVANVITLALASIILLLKIKATIAQKAKS